MTGFRWFSKIFICFCASDKNSFSIGSVNLLMLLALVKDLTNLVISSLQNHPLENI